MATGMVIFVQSIFVLVTFVNIRNNFDQTLKVDSKQGLRRTQKLQQCTTHVYKVSFREWGGDNNRTFAFWGRKLVPAAVFLAFSEGFCTSFSCILVVKASGSSKMQ